ncbi:hypothetical protein MHU86_1149 [Fragilaria crotonensis]|nr:hypothetical protein MHU86_1149 [Fragilaria crotonensis]
MYGGRMLGLYDSANRRDEEDDEVVLGDGTEGNGGKWMKPILFAQLPAAVSEVGDPKFEREGSFSFENVDMVEAQNGLRLTTLNCNLDVPVWIEMLDRTERRRKLVVPSEADDPVTQRQESLENMPSMTDDDGEQLTEDEIDFDQAERTPRTKGRKIMDQIAKTVNFDQFARSVATSTAKTGKQVVKQGKRLELLLERRSSLQFRGQRLPFNIQRNRRPETRRRRKSHLE